MKRISATLGTLFVFAGALSLMGVDCGGAADCAYNGKTFHDGNTFPSDDGCNTCSCQNGSVACTLRACAPTWFRTCGDPVCRTDGHVADPRIPACTTQKAGDPCTTIDQLCDPNDSCNVHLKCTTSDPTRQAGGCPISRAKYKRDIHYLDDAERADVEKTLLGTRLATYRYRAHGHDGPIQLGFIIDDVKGGPSINPDGESVNLYGYTSMTVAAVQAQARELAELKAEVAEMRTLLLKVKPAKR